MQFLTLRSTVLIAAIALAIACLPGSTTLGSDPTTISVLDKPAEELTPADFQRFIALASSNQLTASQVQAFIARLSPEQEQTLRSMSEAKIRADLQNVKKSRP